VTNTDERAGKHVIQVYAEKHDSIVERHARWLIGFTVVRANAGVSTEIAIPLTRRSLAHWDDGWKYEPGDYTLHIGSSVAELPHTVTVDLNG
jgi:beta-glucosidase